jgi:hypothetical protein
MVLAFGAMGGHGAWLVAGGAQRAPCALLLLLLLRAAAAAAATQPAATAEFTKQHPGAQSAFAIRHSRWGSGGRGRGRGRGSEGSTDIQRADRPGRGG